MAFDASAYNTPQARDDLHSVAEAHTEVASNHIHGFDVMTKYLGGKSKTLWSIDDGETHAACFGLIE